MRSPVLLKESKQTAVPPSPHGKTEVVTGGYYLAAVFNDLFNVLAIHQVRFMDPVELVSWQQLFIFRYGIAHDGLFYLPFFEECHL
jgi:hypothetical protein